MESRVGHQVLTRLLLHFLLCSFLCDIMIFMPYYNIYYVYMLCTHTCICIFLSKYYFRIASQGQEVCSLYNDMGSMTFFFFAKIKKLVHDVLKFEK